MQPTEPSQETQTELLRRIAAGDLQALADFYDQTANPLFSVAVRIVGDPGEAEEVIQDVFVQIWEKAATYDPLLSPAFSWALTITRRRSIDRLRGRQRRARLLEAAQEETPGDPTSPGESPMGTMDADEQGAVRSALGKLPLEQRQAIELAFFGGKTHHEIAAMLNEPLGTIKARIRRGLLKLRESLHTYA